LVLVCFLGFGLFPWFWFISLQNKTKEINQNQGNKPKPRKQTKTNETNQNQGNKTKPRKQTKTKETKQNQGNKPNIPYCVGFYLYLLLVRTIFSVSSPRFDGKIRHFSHS
jgi:hypothetical protein